MLDHARTVFEALRSYSDSILADVTAEECCRQPFPGANHAAWTVGHTAIALDRAAVLLGGESRLGEWAPLFGRGTTPSSDASAYPAWSELVAGFRDVCERVAAAAPAATVEQLSAPNTAVMPDRLPTAGDLVAFLMTAHTAMHLGQLAAWRRAIGREVLF